MRTNHKILNVRSPSVYKTRSDVHYYFLFQTEGKFAKPNMFSLLCLILLLIQTIVNVNSADHEQWNPKGYHFESFFLADFLNNGTADRLNGIANLVAYLNFPKGVHLYGTLKITLTGGYNYQLTTGILKKRFHLIYHGQSGLLNQLTEITDSSGSLPSQWKIGNLDSQTHRIPIYHLVPSGNVLIVEVEATTIHEGYPNHLITISDPIVSNNSNKPWQSDSNASLGSGWKILFLK